MMDAPPEAALGPTISIGGVGSEIHDKAVRRALEYENYYRDRLSTPFQSSVRDWKDYLGDRTDRRGAHEKWRANVHIPIPHSTAEAEIGVIVDNFMSPDPLVEPEAVRVKDESRARALTAAYDYWLRSGHFRRFLTTLVRATKVQGTEGFKLLWDDDSVTFPYQPSQDEIQRFVGAVQMASQQFGMPPAPDFQTDPQGFAEWRRQVNEMAMTSSLPLSIPEPPVRVLSITRYRGPKLVRIPWYELRFDPRIEETAAQPVILHRMLKSKQWVQSQVEAGRFDAAQVETALRNFTGEKFSQWEDQVSSMMGVGGSEADAVNHYRDAVEIMEMFSPEDPEVKHAIILNRHAIVNTNPESMPYWDGGHCVGFLRDTLVPGYAIGMPFMKQIRPLFVEKDTLRSLRLDALTLAVLPVYLKQAGLGPVEMDSFLRPGLLATVSNVNGIVPLTKPQLPDAAFREDAQIDADIADYRSTYASVKGAPATVGRVSATDTERRFTQALSKHKLTVSSYEDDLSPFIPKMALLQYQKGDPELMVKLSGDNENPFATVKREDFLEAINMDFRFRGATKSLNRDAIIQQITQIVKEFMGVLAPSEIRAAGARMYDTSNLKGKEEVFQPENEALLQTNWTLTQQVQGLQLQMQSMQMQLQMGPLAQQLQQQQQMAQLQAAADQGDQQAAAQLQQMQQQQAAQQQAAAQQQQQTGGQNGQQ